MLSFDLDRLFAGKTKGVGEISFFKGHIKLGVKGSFNGRWDAEKKILTLEEYLEFSNGRTQERVWRFSKIASSQWSGECPVDVPGGAKGRIDGNELRLAYTFMVPVFANIRIPVVCDDVMILEPNDTISNINRLSLFNVIPLGELKLKISRA